MKRKREWTIIKIISALILFAGVLTPVRADVIAEPQDPFYKEHAEECTYVGQYYRVIAVKGAFLYTAPQSAEILGQVPTATPGAFRRWRESWPVPQSG